MEDQPGLLLMSVLHDRFGFFPGRNHKYIINPELMEVLFPVVDPVDILCLVNGDGSLTQICKGADLLDLCQDLLPDLFRSSAGPSGRISTNICSFSEVVRGTLSSIWAPYSPISSIKLISISSASVLVRTLNLIHFMSRHVLPVKI